MGGGLESAVRLWRNQSVALSRRNNGHLVSDAACYFMLLKHITKVINLERNTTLDIYYTNPNVSLMLILVLSVQFQVKESVCVNLEEMSIVTYSANLQ